MRTRREPRYHRHRGLAIPAGPPRPARVQGWSGSAFYGCCARPDPAVWEHQGRAADGGWSTTAVPSDTLTASAHNTRNR